MKKIVLSLFVLVSLLLFANSVFALDPDPAYQYCVEGGYEADVVNDLCVFDTLGVDSCPLGEFYSGTCGVDYQNGLQCSDPLVAYNSDCVDPLPVCSNFVENSMFCVDKIENGQITEQFNVICYDGWSKVEPTYDAFGFVLTGVECVNSCDAPYIPIDGQCIDPVPACENPPLNSVPSSCVDKIELDGSIVSNYEFQCMDGYEKDGSVCSLVEAAFSDVTGYKYESAIEYVKDNAIVNGYDDGTYRPHNLINRAEFTKIIVGALYSEDDYMSFDDANCFSDVASIQWFTKYVCFAKDKGIIDGYSDGTFQPASNINYVESLKVILEAYVQKGLIDELAVITSDGVMDLPWYYLYVEFASDNALDFHFDLELDQSITRGQTAEMIRWMDLDLE